MPTPLDILADPITQAMLAMFAALALAERLFPGRPLPRVVGWRLRALPVFAIYLLLSSYLPLLWADALAPLRLLDLFPDTRGAVSSVQAFVAIMIAAATMGIAVPALHGSLLLLALGSLVGAFSGWGLWRMAWRAPAR